METDAASEGVPGASSAEVIHHPFGSTYNHIQVGPWRCVRCQPVQLWPPPWAATHDLGPEPLCVPRT